MVKKWIITGGCGFIGTNLVKNLVEEGGHLIRVLDNLSVGTRQDLSMVCNFEELDPSSKNVNDSAYLLRIIAGYDKRDSTSANIVVPDYISFLNNDIKGLKIGIPDEYFGQGLDDTIKNRIFYVIEQLKDSGAIIKKISLPHSNYGIASYYIIATAEASSNLARYDSNRYG